MQLPPCYVTLNDFVFNDYLEKLQSLREGSVTARGDGGPTGRTRSTQLTFHPRWTEIKDKKIK